MKLCVEECISWNKFHSQWISGDIFSQSSSVLTSACAVFLWGIHSYDLSARRALTHYTIQSSAIPGVCVVC